MAEHPDVDNAYARSVDDLVRNNTNYAADFDGSELAVAPRRNLAVVTCMDARVDPYQLLGLVNGDAHVIRNGGGVVTDDVIRSLCLSQRYMGTREIVLIHHTQCGLQTIDEGEFRIELESELGIKPSWSLEGFADPYRDVEQSVQRLKRSPFIAQKEHIYGFVYDVADGLLREVTGDTRL